MWAYILIPAIALLVAVVGIWVDESQKRFVVRPPTLARLILSFFALVFCGLTIYSSVSAISDERERTHQANVARQQDSLVFQNLLSQAEDNGRKSDTLRWYGDTLRWKTEELNALLSRRTHELSLENTCLAQKLDSAAYELRDSRLFSEILQADPIPNPRGVINFDISFGDWRAYAGACLRMFDHMEQCSVRWSLRAEFGVEWFTTAIHVPCFGQGFALDDCFPDCDYTAPQSIDSWLSSPNFEYSTSINTGLRPGIEFGTGFVTDALLGQLRHLHSNGDLNDFSVWSYSPDTLRPGWLHRFFSKGLPVVILTMEVCNEMTDSLANEIAMTWDSVFRRVEIAIEVKPSSDLWLTVPLAIGDAGRGRPPFPMSGFRAYADHGHCVNFQPRDAVFVIWVVADKPSVRQQYFQPRDRTPLKPASPERRSRGKGP